MKKIFLYSLAVLASIILASCNGNYDDWAQPQHNPEEEAITIPGFTATPVVQSIDCSNVTTDSVSIFTLSEAALPEGFTLDNARLEIIPQGEDNAIKKTVNASIEGKAAVADLSEVIVSFYGRRPIAHSFVAHVYLNAVKNGDAVLIDAGKFNLEMTPKSPFIDSGYYLVGDMFNVEAVGDAAAVDGWNTVSAKQAFMHSDKDVYDDHTGTKGPYAVHRQRRDAEAIRMGEDRGGRRRRADRVEAPRRAGQLQHDLCPGRIRCGAGRGRP